jgi:hypothetical protein
LKYVAQADEVWHAGDIGNLAVTDAKKAKTVALCMGTLTMLRFEWNFHNRFM